MLIPVAAFGGRGALRTGALILLTPPFYFLLGAGTVGLLLPLGLVLTLALAAIDVTPGETSSGETAAHT